MYNGLGCTDENANNYNEEANYDDGSCEYPTFPYDCAGNCYDDNDGDGICDETDQCPEDPMGWVDSNGDGICDENDDNDD